MNAPPAASFRVRVDASNPDSSLPAARCWSFPTGCAPARAGGSRA